MFLSASVSLHRNQVLGNGCASDWIIARSKNARTSDHKIKQSLSVCLLLVAPLGLEDQFQH